MKDDTVVAFRQPGSFSDDPLTDILRAGARQLLAQAVAGPTGRFQLQGRTVHLTSPFQEWRRRA